MITGQSFTVTFRAAFRRSINSASLAFKWSEPRRSALGVLCPEPYCTVVHVFPSQRGNLAITFSKLIFCFRGTR